ncbi:hypothetical protein I350_00954 [Cryptococcus amylolentus CBS 6273]|uniref:Uncharacterized protein n=1 Tax=Cryptococcus amylolentus CBS 6273 TaxID=1296118 RepID=A0A1E3KB70_9TREE|nr:hypothetical protein I350_00954 [Cryptococcus amylolentus CBS 6273]
MSTPTPVTIPGSTGLTGSETSGPPHLLKPLFHHHRHPPPHPFPLPQMQTHKRPNSPRRTNLSIVLRCSRRYCPRKARTRGRSVYVVPATTRVNGKKDQEKVDSELNRDLVTRAKADGARTVSPSTDVKLTIPRLSSYLTLTHSPDSSFFHLRIKGQLEEHFATLGFDHVVILKLGMLLGPREQVD